MSFPRKTSRDTGGGRPVLDRFQAKKTIPVRTQEPARPPAHESRTQGRWMPPWKKWKLEREEKKRREEEERRRKEEEERERTRQMMKKYGPAMLGILAAVVLITLPLSIWSERQEKEVAAVNGLAQSAIVLSEQDRSQDDGPDATDATDTGAPPEDTPAPEDGAPSEDNTQPEDGTEAGQDSAAQEPSSTAPPEGGASPSASGSGGSTKTETPAESKGTSGAAAPSSNTATAGTTYVLNTNSMKFHKPYCSSAKKISAENRWNFSGTRDEVIAMGYEPCKNCNP